MEKYDFSVNYLRRDERNKSNQLFVDLSRLFFISLMSMLLTTAGKYLADPSVPKYSNLFSEASMDDYFSRVSPAYCQSGGARRFLIQRELFDVNGHTPLI
jgi:hypothetical protein